MAAQSRGSVKVLVQPLKDSLEAMATLFFSAFGQDLEDEFGAAAVEFPVLGRGRPPNRTCPLAEHPALHVIRWIRRGIR
ncbi:hypothetical protein QFZ32_008537 [Streptomyces canus]|nr:hypothetical protein [Streptomyces canus]